MRLLLFAPETSCNAVRKRLCVRWTKFPLSYSVSLRCIIMVNAHLRLPLQCILSLEQHCSPGCIGLGILSQMVCIFGRFPQRRCCSNGHKAAERGAAGRVCNVSSSPSLLLAQKAAVVFTGMLPRFRLFFGKILNASHLKSCLVISPCTRSASTSLCCSGNSVVQRNAQKLMRGHPRGAALGAAHSDSLDSVCA